MRCTRDRRKDRPEMEEVYLKLKANSIYYREWLTSVKLEFRNFGNKPELYDLYDDV